MRQLIRLTPGGSISATEFNRAMAEIEKAIRLTVSAPLQLTEGWDAQNISLGRRQMMAVRITDHFPSGSSGGHCSGTGSGGAGSGSPGFNVPAYFYSGIEQISKMDGTVDDNITGIHFDKCAFPLVEMAENEDVPIDGIAYAWPAVTGDHYEFIWAEGGTSSRCHESGSGSGQSGQCSSCTLPVCELFECQDGQATARDACIAVVDDNGHYIGRVTLIPGNGTCLEPTPGCDESGS